MRLSFVINSGEAVEKSPINKSNKYVRCTFHQIARKPSYDQILWNLANEVRSPTLSCKPNSE